MVLRRNLADMEELVDIYFAWSIDKEVSFELEAFVDYVDDFQDDKKVSFWIKTIVLFQALIIFFWIWDH